MRYSWASGPSLRDKAPVYMLSKMGSQAAYFQKASNGSERYFRNMRSKKISSKGEKRTYKAVYSIR